MDFIKKILFSENKIGLYILILITLSLFQYSVGLRNDFVWDAELIIKNTSVYEFKNIPSFFMKDLFADQAAWEPSIKYYRPLLKVFYLLEYKAFGTNPAGYNAVNIILNAGVVVLCFFLVSGITGNIRTGFLSSLIYAVNPTHVEAVSWIYGNSTLLTAFLCFLSLFFYHKQKYAYSLVSFSAALLVRENAVLLPAIIFFYELLIRKSKDPKNYLKILLFISVTLFYLIARKIAVGPLPLTDLDFFTLFNSSAIIIKRHIKIFFIPDSAATAYEVKLFNTISREVMISYFTLAGALFTGIIIRLKERKIFFWYLWFFIWISISFNTGRFAEYLMGEKEMLFPSLGFCVIIASLFQAVPVKKTMASILLAGLVITHSGITFWRTFFWKDSITYLEKVVEFAPDFYLPRAALADRYLEKRNYYKALEEYKTTINLFPLHPTAFSNMGYIYFINGDSGKALEMWKIAVEVNPSNPQPYYNIAVLFQKTGDLEKSLYYYRKYLDLAPNPDLQIISRVKELEAGLSK
jgi:protein O-mannosyl-transferase